MTDVSPTPPSTVISSQTTATHHTLSPSIHPIPSHPFPQPACPPPRRSRRPSTTSATAFVGDGPDDAAASGDDITEAPNPLFANNPAFAAVFKSALGRGGASALNSGPPADDPGARVGLEEVLHTALRNQRALLLELEDGKKRIAAQLVREQRQFERLQFALKKSISDHAYTTSMDKLRVREKQEWETERGRLTRKEGGDV